MRGGFCLSKVCLKWGGWYNNKQGRVLLNIYGYILYDPTRQGKVTF